MDHGSLYRRCGCRDENTGKLLGARFESSRILWVGPSTAIRGVVDQDVDLTRHLGRPPGQILGRAPRCAGQRG
jgi:hypothetical protein